MSADSSGGIAPSTTGGEIAQGTMIGEYRVEGMLGKGGMGAVYSAIHPVIAKKAAIKILHPALSVNREAVERFVQEARAVNQIGHPNIVDIFAFGSLPDGRSYFVMEWLRGETLADRNERERLPLADALVMFETITIALEAAHEKGIVHRDLKPDNVFLVEVKGDRPQVKLLDFGIAKLSGNDSTLSQRTQTGNMMGTPAYISPEQARGYAVDFRTDIYALGAMAFEIFAGELPFSDADNAADMIAKHLYEAPRRLASLNPNAPPELDDLVAQMLAKEAKDRPELAFVRDVLRQARQTIAMNMLGGNLVGDATTPDIRISSLAATAPGRRTPLPGELRRPGTAPVDVQAPTEFGSNTAPLPVAKPKSRGLVIGVAALALAIGGGVVFAVTRGDDKPVVPPAPAPAPIVQIKEVPVMVPVPTPAPPAPPPDPTPAVAETPPKPPDPPKQVVKPPAIHKGSPVKKPPTGKPPVKKPAADDDAPM